METERKDLGCSYQSLVLQHGQHGAREPFLKLLVTGDDYRSVLLTYRPQIVQDKWLHRTIVARAIHLEPNYTGQLDMCLSLCAYPHVLTDRQQKECLRRAVDLMQDTEQALHFHQHIWGSDDFDLRHIAERSGIPAYLGNKMVTMCPDLTVSIGVLRKGSFLRDKTLTILFEHALGQAKTTTDCYSLPIYASDADQLFIHRAERAYTLARTYEDFVLVFDNAHGVQRLKKQSYRNICRLANQEQLKGALFGRISRDATKNCVPIGIAFMPRILEDITDVDTALEYHRISSEDCLDHFQDVTNKVMLYHALALCKNLDDVIKIIAEFAGDHRDEFHFKGTKSRYMGQWKDIWRKALSFTKTPDDAERLRTKIPYENIEYFEHTLRMHEKKFTK